MLDTPTQKSFDQRFTMVRSLKPEDIIPLEEQAQFTLMDARRHSFFSFLKENFFIREVAKYHETSSDFKKTTGFSTTELTCTCLETGQTIHFEYEHDDKLEVSVTLWQIKFRDLFDEEGLNIDEDDLDQIAEDKDVIIYKGEKYWYDDDWAALYEATDRAENVFVYEFENENGNSTITIEEWQGEGRDEYRLYVSKPVDALEFTLLSKGE
ncbi:MAG: DUF4178 domain-containing protein [Desulfobacterales bacterium]|nr:DUF4178 domain-containing protein [Desulfobacterales bacterium]